jgi:hypothetical protein
VIYTCDYLLISSVWGCGLSVPLLLADAGCGCMPAVSLSACFSDSLLIDLNRSRSIYAPCHHCNMRGWFTEVLLTAVGLISLHAYCCCIWVCTDIIMTCVWIFPTTISCPYIFVLCHTTPPHLCNDNQMHDSCSVLLPRHRRTQGLATLGPCPGS